MCGAVDGHLLQVLFSRKQDQVSEVYDIAKLFITDIKPEQAIRHFSFAIIHQTNAVR